MEAVWLDAGSLIFRRNLGTVVYGQVTLELKIMVSAVRFCPSASMAYQTSTMVMSCSTSMSFFFSR